MDWPVILTAIGTGITVVGTGIGVVSFVYIFFRNFKTDINERFNKIDIRFNNIDAKIISLEERMFWLSTGKTLSQAILDEKMKQEKEKE